MVYWESIEVSAEYFLCIIIKPKLMFCEFVQYQLCINQNTGINHFESLAKKLEWHQALYISCPCVVELYNSSSLLFLHKYNIVHHGVSWYPIIKSLSLSSTGPTSINLLYTQQNGLRRESIMLPLTCLVHCLSLKVEQIILFMIL